MGTVISRIERMEQTGVIKGYSARIDHEMIGFDLTVVIEITVSKGKLLETEKSIAKLAAVNAVYDVTGESDIIVIARFRTRSELSTFTKELLSTPFVERTNTKLALTTIKEDFWHLME